MKKFVHYLVIAAVFGAIVGCGVNSVTKAQLEAVKPGNTLVYRFQKDGKSWFYADKINRIEGDTIYANPSRKEGTAGNDDRIYDFDTGREVTISKTDLLKYETEQGDDKKVIIWIK
jgi:hypothetical protein